MANWNDRLNEAALSYRCEKCGAEPLHWCRTKSGKRATYLHAAREEPIRMAMHWAVLETERELEASS